MLVGTAVGIVTGRVIGCIGDAGCTFAPGALQTAVLAFAGGPLVIAAVWVVPALQGRGVAAAASARVALCLLGLGVGAVALGVWTMRGGDPVGAILPALAPGVLMAGALVWGGRMARDE